MNMLKVSPVIDDPVIRAALKRGPKRRKVQAPAKLQRPRVWAVDFDGTICKNWYPNIGPPNEQLISILKFAKSHGVQLILWTCREGALLDAAVSWCSEHEITFDAVNENTKEAIDYWGSNPRKVGADLYIEDKSFRVDGDLCELMNMVVS